MPKKGSPLILPVLFFAFFNCGDNKNGNPSSQQTENKVDSVQFYKTIEGFPIFNTELGRITSVEKSKLERCLKSREDDFKKFLSLQENIGHGDIEKDLLSYKESFFKWLKGKTGDKFVQLVGSEYISKKFDQSSLLMVQEGEKVRCYSAFLKAKLAKELSRLTLIDLFCCEIDDKYYLDNNRRILIFVDMIAASKDLKTPENVLDRVFKNASFGGVVSREELIEIAYLCLDLIAI